jgi:hypothetical protein
MGTYIPDRKTVENIDAYMNAWKTMYNAISGNDMIHMYWSPNVDTSSEPVAPWWPGKEYVSILKTAVSFSPRPTTSSDS